MRNSGAKRARTTVEGGSVKVEKNDRDKQRTVCTCKLQTTDFIPNYLGTIKQIYTRKEGTENEAVGWIILGEKDEERHRLWVA